MSFTRVLILVLVASVAGCGPALRMRSPDILAKGDVEVGAGIGLAGDVQTGGYGGAEVAAWVRGSPSNYSEVGGRFWTSSFNTFGGALEVRIAPVRRPVAFSIDLGLQAAACCGSGARNHTAGIGGGFDAGFTFGGRILNDFGPAPYFSPHFQMTWVFPPDPGFEAGRMLFLPVGVDIPLGKSPFHLRPEFIVAVTFPKGLDPGVRLGGGIGFAISGPGAEKVKAEQQAKKAAQDEATPAPATQPLH